MTFYLNLRHATSFHENADGLHSRGVYCTGCLPDAGKNLRYIALDSATYTATCCNCGRQTTGNRVQGEPGLEVWIPAPRRTQEDVEEEIAAALWMSPDGTYRIDRAVCATEPSTFTREFRLTGYQVGRPDITKGIVNPGFTALHDWLFVNDNPMVDPGYAVSIGKWTDPETGDCYFDASVCTPDRDKAIAVARRVGEKAIWCWATSTSINVHES